MHIGVPLVINLAWGLFVLVAVPLLPQDAPFLYAVHAADAGLYTIGEWRCCAWARCGRCCVCLAMRSSRTTATPLVDAPVTQHRERLIEHKI